MRNRIQYAGFYRKWPIALAACIMLPACIPEPEVVTAAPPLVPAIRIADASALTERVFPGRARAGQQVNLSFRVTGPLVELPVNVGDKVSAGDVVARIDPEDYINTLGSVTGQLEQAQAASTRAEADFRRVQNVYNEDPGATSESDLDLKRSLRDASSARVKSMTSAVKIAQDKVNYTSLQAPFSGEVVATYVENFETVLPKQPVLRLLDPSSIEFVINVPENLISHAAHVREVSVSFEALPGLDVPATIKEIGREASSATRTYPVTLLMTQPEGAEILPGMAGTASVNALLPAAARDSGINIPATAVFSQDDPKKSYVWIIDPTSKALVSREVETGNLTETGLLIRSGLKPGDWLVTKGVHSITEGQLVRILDLSGEGA